MMKRVRGEVVGVFVVPLISGVCGIELDRGILMAVFILLILFTVCVVV